MLARTPVTLARVAAPKPVKRLPSHRRAAIRDAIANLMREAEPTPFAVEGPGRAGVRARLCLDGWPWGQADAAAADVVQAALQIVGAKRPTWEQGQPDWTQEAVLPIQRERCARCGKSLPDDSEGWRKYCGPLCAKAAKVDLRTMKDQADDYAKRKAWLASWSKKQPAKECPGCGRAFRPKYQDAKYCSKKCFNDARRFAGRKMPMVCEAVRDE
jgi:hypothetical protein